MPVAGYQHGVYIEEVATPIVPARRVNASLPVFVGVAPTWMTTDHREDAVNTPILAYDRAEAETWLGYAEDWGDYSLSEALYVFFQVYGMAPVIFINAFDPYGNADHRNIQDSVVQALAAGSLTVTDTDPVQEILIDLVEVWDEAGAVQYELDTDFSLAYDADFQVVVTRLSDGAIPAEDTTLLVKFNTAKPGGVTAADIVTALDAVEQVYPTHVMIPGQIAAPGWSLNTTVAAAMLARAIDINDSFRCLALVDIDTDASTGADVYTEANTEKTANSWSDPHMIACWPLVQIGSGDDAKMCYLSTHLAAVIARTDYDFNGIPYASPSNHALQITGAVTAAGAAVLLGRDQANTLNGQGIVTALNWEGGWRAWGNRTSDYPSSTDPKDTFIPGRRMMDYVGNILVATFFQKVDFPITRRNVDIIIDSVNDWLNGLVGRGAILSGECVLLESDNPTSALIDGIVRFRVNLGLAMPAEVITFILAMDPDAVSALWE